MTKMVDVVSSNIKAIGFDELKNELTVEFNSGSKYVYESVPVSIYETFLEAESKGKYFHRNVRNVYSYSRV